VSWTRALVDEAPFLCLILGNPFATKRKRLNNSLAIEPPIWWVSKMTHWLQPSNSTNQLDSGTFQAFKRKLKPTIASAIKLHWRMVLVAT
jgi:hypothetical protein